MNYMRVISEDLILGDAGRCSHFILKTSSSTAMDAKFPTYCSVTIPNANQVTSSFVY